MPLKMAAYSQPQWKEDRVEGWNAVSRDNQEEQKGTRRRRRRIQTQGLPDCWGGGRQQGTMRLGIVIAELLLLYSPEGEVSRGKYQKGIPLRMSGKGNHWRSCFLLRISGCMSQGPLLYNRICPLRAPLFNADFLRSTSLLGTRTYTWLCWTGRKLARGSSKVGDRDLVVAYLHLGLCFQPGKCRGRKVGLLL